MDALMRWMRWVTWTPLRKSQEIQSSLSLFTTTRYDFPYHLSVNQDILTQSQCPVSQIISDALAPLVPTHPAVHFVRVHYADIEFDNAGVPAILAYKNQGDLFANLTYIIDQIPDDTLFDTRALETILRKHKII